MKQSHLDPKENDWKDFLLNEDIFPKTLFDLDQFPIECFSFKCVPGRALMNNDDKKYKNKLFFKNDNIGKERGLKFHHFFENNWLLF